MAFKARGVPLKSAAAWLWSQYGSFSDVPQRIAPDVNPYGQPAGLAVTANPSLKWPLGYFDIAKSATDPLPNDSPLITPLVMVAAGAAAGAAPPTI